jgi:WD40 repeat protein
LSVDTTNNFKFRVRSSSSGYSIELSIAYIQNYALSTGIRNITSEINDVAFSPNGQFLASGHQDGTTTLWNTSTSGLVRTFSGPTNQIYAVSFSSSGDTLATASFDGSVILWNTNAGSQIKQLLSRSLDSDGATDVEFSPSGRYVAAITMFGRTTIWDLHNNASSVSFGYNGFGRPRSLSFSPDEKSILITGPTTTITGTQDYTVQTVDIASRQPLRSFYGFYTCWDVQWNPQGPFILLNDASSRCYSLIDLLSGQELWRLNGTRIRFDHSGARLISQGQIYEIASKRVVASAGMGTTLPGLFAFSTDDALIINVYYSTASIYKISGRTWKPIF